jgi:N-acyl-D-amino-acid deacylase
MRIATVVALALAVAVGAAGADFEVLIKNARIVDGTGNGWYRGDIGIAKGRIAAVGMLAGKSAERVIDARGRVAAPGFIDVHTHIEGAVEKVPRGDNYLLDGVTTVVTGNCGSSMVKMGEWFAELEKTGIGINVAALVGHNSVRREVMGSANRKATDEEISQMQALVETAMREGAVGFSTGLIYIPGTYSETKEVVEVARAAAKHGGVYASHMRDEGAQVMEAIAEAAQVGAETGMRVQLSHFKIDNRKLWGMSAKTLGLVEEFRRKGVDVVIDQYPYDRSSTNLGITLPTWALADGAKAVKERLDAPQTRRRIAAEMKQMLEDKGLKDYEYAMVGAYAKDRSIEGKTIAEIVKGRGKAGTVDEQIELIFEITAEGGAQMVYHSMGEEDVERIAKWPHTAVASDGGVREFDLGVPHPRSYGTNARVLARHVRERGWLTLEDAVRRMTSLPARTFGFTDRGMIREGMAADVVVFDPAKVEDRATYQDPHQFSAGFDYVVVNGRIAVQGGQLMEVRAGQIVRGAGAVAAQ